MQFIGIAKKMQFQAKPKNGANVWLGSYFNFTVLSLQELHSQSYKSKAFHDRIGIKIR
jgi:hypothetical protein